MKAWFAFFYYQFGSQASKECFKQATRSSDGLEKKLRLWLECTEKLGLLLVHMDVLWITDLTNGSFNALIELAAAHV